MARLNIEDCWWTDPRRSLLIKKLGEERADIVAIRAWRLAQEFWKSNKGLVPDYLFQTLECWQDLIDAKLADVRGAFVYVRGSSAYLDWLREQKETASKAGKASAEARKKKTGTAQPNGRNAKKQSTEHSEKSNGNRTESNGIEPSVSGSYSVSGSCSVSNLDSLVSEAPSDDSVPKNSASKELNKKIWESYFEAYKSRYGVEPVRNAKVNGIVSSLGKRLGEDAVAVVAFFLTSNNSYYLQRTHAIDCCLRDAESLHVQWQKGRAITQKDVQEFSKKAVMAETLKAIKEGTI